MHVEESDRVRAAAERPYGFLEDPDSVADVDAARRYAREYRKQDRRMSGMTEEEMIAYALSLSEAQQHDTGSQVPEQESESIRSPTCGNDGHGGGGGPGPVNESDGATTTTTSAFSDTFGGGFGAMCQDDFVSEEDFELLLALERSRLEC